jgi:hypothetical protein
MVFIELLALNLRLSDKSIVFLYCLTIIVIKTTVLKLKKNERVIILINDGAKQLR